MREKLTCAVGTEKQQVAIDVTPNRSAKSGFSPEAYPEAFKALFLLLVLAIVLEIGTRSPVQLAAVCRDL